MSKLTAEIFDKGVGEPTVGGCTLWMGRKNEDGYGIVYVEGRPKLAHRICFSIKKHAIPDGLCVCHSCDNPPCVNPAHLWIGTRGDNNRDRTAKGRTARTTGDRNGSRTHPETRLRGSASPFHALAEKYSIGVANNKAKLDDNKVREMRAIRAETMRSFSSIAREYGVTKAAARFAISGITWKHIK